MMSWGGKRCCSSKIKEKVWRIEHTSTHNFAIIEKLNNMEQAFKQPKVIHNLIGEKVDCVEQLSATECVFDNKKDANAFCKKMSTQLKENLEVVGISKS